MKRNEIRTLIDETAKATAEAFAGRVRGNERINYYAATEQLLRNYKRLALLVADASDYVESAEHARSKSVVFMTGSGGYRSPDEAGAEKLAARELSYARTEARFRELDGVVKLFAGKQEFIVIRMYYFNEDSSGRQRDEDCKRYTFEEIAEELAAAGLERNERTLRGWRTQIVQDMAVCIFGPDAAANIQQYRADKNP